MSIRVHGIFTTSKNTPLCFWQFGFITVNFTKLRLTTVIFTVLCQIYTWLFKVSDKNIYIFLFHSHILSFSSCFTIYLYIFFFPFIFLFLVDSIYLSPALFLSLFLFFSPLFLSSPLSLSCILQTLYHDNKLMYNVLTKHLSTFNKNTIICSSIATLFVLVSVRLAASCIQR